MKFFKFAKEFSRDEEAAVTVDWVILTTAVVGLGVAVWGTATSAPKTFSAKSSQNLEARTVIYY